MTANDRVGEIEIFDHGLQCAGMVLLDITAKDDADFVGLSNGAVGIDQPLTEFIDCTAAREDQVVAIIRSGKRRAGVRLLPALNRCEINGALFDFGPIVLMVPPSH